MQDGWNAGGVQAGLITRLTIREVCGFMYYRADHGDDAHSSEYLSQKAKEYWNRKLYLDALRNWATTVRPSNIQVLTALQNVQPRNLTTKHLVAHINNCIAITKSMVRTHHLFSCAALVPIGDIIRQVCEWTGEQPSVIVESLDIASKTIAPLGEFASMACGINEKPPANSEAKQILEGVSGNYDQPNFLLEHLRTLGSDVASYIDGLVDHIGFRIIQGYDITSETIIERPDVLLQYVASIYCQSNKPVSTEAISLNTSSVRTNIPLQVRSAFDELIPELRSLQRLRYERGFFSDLWAIGILRHAYLEVGKRLAESGCLDDSSLVIDVSPRELTQMFRDRLKVSSDELRLRANDRTTRSVKDAPAVLGDISATAPKVPNVSSEVARSEKSFAIAMALAVDKPNTAPRDGSIYKGKGASRGISEGPARVLKDGSTDAIRRGDILVVHQATASLGVVLPLICGIVSETGGILSHAAILSRQYGVPCIVGCIGILDSVRSGTILRIDGSEGTVEVL
jgi:pyruvate,water dikinase